MELGFYGGALGVLKRRGARLTGSGLHWIAVAFVVREEEGEKQAPMLERRKTTTRYRFGGAGPRCKRAQVG